MELFMGYKRSEVQIQRTENGEANRKMHKRASPAQATLFCANEGWRNLLEDRNVWAVSSLKK
jgi:hypothetical protein